MSFQKRRYSSMRSALETWWCTGREARGLLGFIRGNFTSPALVFQCRSVTLFNSQGSQNWHILDKQFLSQHGDQFNNRPGTLHIRQHRICVHQSQQDIVDAQKWIPTVYHHHLQIIDSPGKGFPAKSGFKHFSAILHERRSDAVHWGQLKLSKPLRLQAIRKSFPVHHLHIPVPPCPKVTPHHL